MQFAFHHANDLAGQQFGNFVKPIQAGHIAPSNIEEKPRRVGGIQHLHVRLGDELEKCDSQ